MASKSETKPLIQGDITSPGFLQQQGRVDPNVTLQQKLIAIAWVVVGLPLLITGAFIAAFNVLVIKKYVFPPKKEEKKAKELKVYTPDSNIPHANRKYDLVVYGATGFTGSLAVEFIVQQYCQQPSNLPFRWAVGGRNKAGLERVVQNAIAQHTTPGIRDELINKIDIVVADSGNVEQLREMVRNAKSIVSTTGPFSLYGNDLVALCAAYGTHYSDITGESDWVRRMIDNYESQARESGAILTSMAGHDCIPWDLVCFNAAKQLDKINPNQKVSKFEIYDHIQGQISGGTLLTIIHSLSDRQREVTKLGFDPMMSLFGQKSTHDLKVQNQSVLGYNKTVKSWVGPFVMAAVMGNCVKRSCAINKYSAANSKAIYEEIFCYNSLWEAIPNFLGLFALGIGLFIPGIPSVLSRLLPPGSGPTRQQQQDGYLLIQCVASGDKGNKAEAWCYIPKDPGYFYTARLLVETGLVPILNKNQLSTLPNFDKTRGSIGGYWTPASGIGPLIQERLEGIGVQFVTRPFRPQAI